jgi:hypothetical protein
MVFSTCARAAARSAPVFVRSASFASSAVWNDCFASSAACSDRSRRLRALQLGRELRLPHVRVAELSFETQPPGRRFVHVNFRVAQSLLELPALSRHLVDLSFRFAQPRLDLPPPSCRLVQARRQRCRFGGELRQFRLARCEPCFQFQLRIE